MFKMIVHPLALCPTKSTTASSSLKISSTLSSPFPVNCMKNHPNGSGGSGPLDSCLGVKETETPSKQQLKACRFCRFCGRRHFLEAIATTTLSTGAFFPICPSNASSKQLDYLATLNEVHSPRPDWYEEFYASFMSSGMKSYEAEIAACKAELFANLRGKAKKVLEVGIGTGPNLKYYASENGVQVFGVDPNKKMERYAIESAAAAGLPSSDFKFIQAVGEAIPLNDSSVDAVVGTLVLCSVKDVDQTLQEVKRVLKPGGVYFFVEHVAAKDGTVLRLLQNALDPLQQVLADGCHLTRKTGNDILKAGFSEVDLSTTFLSIASFINPHLYGTAKK